jgi:glycine betaine/choline ABC-type transport system substrate-binding protein
MTDQPGVPGAGPDPSTTPEPREPTTGPTATTEAATTEAATTEAATGAPPPPAQGASTPPPPPADATPAGSTGGGTNWLPWLGGLVVVAIIAIFLFRPGGPLNTGEATPEPSPSAAPSASPAEVSPSAQASIEASPSPSPNPPIASEFVLGGPPECPDRPFCLVGLQETYGLQFKQFVPLDTGGPLTIEALKGGQIQIGLLFTSDPAISANDFVPLQDDKQLQRADNLVPVVRQEVLTANPGVADVLNAAMAKLSQAELMKLNAAVTIEQKPTADVARDWIAAQGFPTPGGLSGQVTVGSTNFYEQEVLGEVFAQVLEANGLTVERKFQLGNREIVFPALESGQIDILAEYAATALEYVNGGAGQATADPVVTTAALRAALEPKGLVALDFAEATDQNTFVVTKATAETYGLTKLSDLANPAP